MKQVVIYAAVAGSVLAGSAQAQFHNKARETGQVTISQQAQANMVAQQKAKIARGVAGKYGDQTALQNSAMYLPEWAANRGGSIRLGHMEQEEAFYWSQVVNHPDGSYTETKRDNKTMKTTEANQPVEQYTYASNKVLISKRHITHNEFGDPKEVIIRDAQDNFRYRGVLVYDPLTRRLKEEQIFDANGKPLRRNVQKYDTGGHPMPVEIYDYVKNLPQDLQLVITEGENPNPREKGKRWKLFGKSKDQEAGDRLIPGFNKKKKDVTTGPASEPKERKGLGKLFFGGRNKGN